MKTSDIIKKAVLSEKAYKLMEKGVYTFLVAENAAKSEIAKRVASQFGVKVEKVNVSGFAPKTKRNRTNRKTALVGGGKKAIVYLAAGQTISLLSPKAETKTQKAKSKTKEEKKGSKK